MLYREISQLKSILEISHKLMGSYKRMKSFARIPWASRSIGEFPFLIISLIPVMLKGNSDKEL